MGKTIRSSDSKLITADVGVGIGQSTTSSGEGVDTWSNLLKNKLTLSQYLSAMNCEFGYLLSEMIFSPLQTPLVLL